MHPAYPHKGLLVGWRRFVRLHNFQHNLDMPEAQFKLACRRSHRLFDELNGLLPVNLRLSSDSYGWLSGV